MKIYNGGHIPFEEHEETVKERYKKHAAEFKYENGEYYYVYAYGSLQEAYRALFEDYMLLKNEYDERNGIIKIHSNEF